MEIEPDDWEPLADILGQTDAVFAPVRSWGDGSASNAHIARREYPQAGVRWDRGGQTTAERKQVQRWMEDAAKRGLVERSAGGAYATRCRLTEAAELAVRGRCGLSGVAAAASLVEEVSSYRHGSGVPDVIRAAGAVWVPEWPELCGGERNDHRRVVEMMAYPALLRGWLVARSDVGGLVSYAVGPVPVPAGLPAEDPDEYDPAVRAAWAAGLRRRLAALAVRDPETQRELGDIPLPASMGHVTRTACRRS